MSILGDIVAAIRRLIHGRMTYEEIALALDKLAAVAPERLDWRQSIVDLMKLVKQDSSLEARKKLASELGYTGALDGSAAMNIWLHEKVLARLRDEGV